MCVGGEGRVTSKLVSQFQKSILALLVVSIFQMERYVVGSVGPIAIFLPTHSLYYKEDPLGWGDIIWNPMLVD